MTNPVWVKASAAGWGALKRAPLGASFTKMASVLGLVGAAILVKAAAVARTGLPDSKVKTREWAAHVERTLPRPVGTARLGNGEARSSEALPAAAASLGGAGAPGPGAEEPGRRPPRPLLPRGGAVPGGAVAGGSGTAAATAAAAARASSRPPRQVSRRPQPAALPTPAGRSALPLRLPPADPVRCSLPPRPLGRAAGTPRPGAVWTARRGRARSGWDYPGRALSGPGDAALLSGRGSFEFLHLQSCRARVRGAAWVKNRVIIIIIIIIFFLLGEQPSLGLVLDSIFTAHHQVTSSLIEIHVGVFSGAVCKWMGRQLP